MMFFNIDYGSFPTYFDGADDSYLRECYKTNLDRAVTETLKPFGFKFLKNGYEYVRTAVMESLENPPLAHAGSHAIVLKIAERYNLPPKQVDRSMSFAVESMWLYTKPLNREIYYPQCKDRAPSIGNFIYVIHHLAMKSIVSDPTMKSELTELFPVMQKNYRKSALKTLKENPEAANKEAEWNPIMKQILKDRQDKSKKTTEESVNADNFDELSYFDDIAINRTGKESNADKSRLKRSENKPSNKKSKEKKQTKEEKKPDTES